MEINTLRSLVTLLSFVLFLGVVAWTWHRKRRDGFDQAAQLPFIDEDGQEARK